MLLAGLFSGKRRGDGTSRLDYEERLSVPWLTYGVRAHIPLPSPFAESNCSGSKVTNVDKFWTPQLRLLCRRTNARLVLMAPDHEIDEGRYVSDGKEGTRGTQSGASRTVLMKHQHVEPVVLVFVGPQKLHRPIYIVM